MEAVGATIGTDGAAIVDILLFSVLVMASGGTSELSALTISGSKDRDTTAIILFI
jgi:hypothetical protein